MEPYDYILNIANYIPDTLSEGPYRRFAIWVQGCSIRCPSCCNPEMHDFKGGYQITVGKLLDKILSEQNIEGITLLGGEPFDQALSLSKLACEVHKAGLGVMTFSGFYLDTLLDKDDAARNLINETDVLIAGHYIKEKHAANIRWIGSQNQRVHFLTSRYSNCFEFSRPGQSIHLSFFDDTMTISGFPDFFKTV